MIREIKTRSSLFLWIKLWTFHKVFHKTVENFVENSKSNNFFYPQYKKKGVEKIAKKRAFFEISYPQVEK